MTNCAEVLERAERAFVATTNKEARLAALKQLRERVGEARSIFVQSIVREAKKPRALADGEVSRALANIDEAIAFMGRTHEHKVELGNAPGTKGLEAVWRPFPRGIILGITPYNFPLNLVLHKVLPAICSGAPIILKPDPRTPTPAHELARALENSELPDDFLQVVDCSVEDADVFCRDPRVEVISFTGSEGVGWSLKSLHATKHVVLELGGTATAIYAKSSLEEKDVDALARASLVYSGQVCISTQNILVPESQFEEATQKFYQALQKVKRGEPEDPSSVYGPVIDERHAARLLESFHEAERSGATVKCTGKDNGTNLAARLIALPNHHFNIAKEEIFGPALVLIPYSDFADAESIILDLKSTLQGAVFTDDDSLWERAQRCFRTGALLRNRPPTFRVDGMPYGGVQRSGIGREGVAYAFEEFSERRLIIA
ncbi:MAG: aldehyde dehydrogenase family protein [Myxococcota bacterium]|nr:aldehyde dehydrogenase family protein [Myxococcota bacterium]